MKCEMCNHEVEEKWNYCAVCGKQLKPVTFIPYSATKIYRSAYNKQDNPYTPGYIIPN